MNKLIEFRYYFPFTGSPHHGTEREREISAGSTATAASQKNQLINEHSVSFLSGHESRSFPKKVLRFSTPTHSSGFTARPLKIDIKIYHRFVLSRLSFWVMMIQHFKCKCTPFDSVLFISLPMKWTAPPECRVQPDDEDRDWNASNSRLTSCTRSLSVRLT